MILWNYITESSLWKGSRGCPGCPRSPLDPGDPLTTPLWPPGSPLGPPGTPLGPLGTSLRPPGDAPGTSRGPRPLWILMDHKNYYISTNRQRQKHSIAVFEAACRGPSHEGLDRAVLSTKRLPNSNKYRGDCDTADKSAARAQTVKPSPINTLGLRNLYLEVSDIYNRDNWIVAAKRS